MLQVPNPKAMIAAPEEEVRQRMGRFMTNMRNFADGDRVLEAFLGFTWIVRTFFSAAAKH